MTTSPSKLFSRYPLLIIFFCALGLRLWGIGADLPNLYHTDEPHHVNKAAQFGTGDLNPHDFKYPTLWSYFVAGLFGAMYAGARLMGLVQGAAEFAQCYLYQPTAFFLGARLLSAAFNALVPVVFFKIGLRFYSRRVAIAAALFTVLSSSQTEFALQASPYSALIFFEAIALYYLHAFLADGGRANIAKTGFFLGLAVSCHYVAGPCGALLLAAFFRGNLKERISLFTIGVLAAAGGFFLGTPFLLLSLKSAMPFFTEHYHLEDVTVISPSITGQIAGLLMNLARFVDMFGVAALFAATGLVSQLRRRNWRAVVWLFPFLSAFPILAASFFGTSFRYSVLLCVPIVLLSATGLDALLNRWNDSPAKQRATLALVAGLLLISFVKIRWGIAVPDTRTLARTWIEKNVPPNAKVLTAGPYEGPQLLRNRRQLERLYKKTSESGHPRARYFQMLLEGDRLGGYEVIYVQKSVEDVQDLPGRTRRAFEAQESVDVERGGIAPLLNEGIEWIVINKDWDHNARYAEWLAQLRAKGRLEVEFAREPGKNKGSPIQIYRLTAQIHRRTDARSHRSS